MMRAVQLVGRLGFLGVLAAGAYFSLVTELPRAFGGEVTVHVVGYAALMFFAGIGWPDHLLRMLIVVVGLGVVIELAQIRDVWRAFEWSDILYNVIGAGGMAGVLWLLTQFRRP